MISGVDRAIKVLIVEDDLIDRRALERALTRSSLDIGSTRLAASLAEAMAMLEKERPDIVFLDLGLPDSCGLESVASLQKWAHDIPIVVLSGLEDEQLAVSAVQKGVQDYLTKGSIDGTVLSRVVSYAIQRKEYECQLRATEERYRTIFENSAVAIMMADEAGQLISWNRLTEELLGMRSSDLHLRPVESLYPEVQWQKLRSEHIRQKGMQHHLETQMIRKNGEIIDVDISLTVLRNPRGDVTGSIAVVQDITEKKRAETALRERQERLNSATAQAKEMALRAEAANAAKSQFLANMTHEIRTPMNAIIGFSDILADDDLTPEQAGYVELIRNSGRHLLGLINDVLDLSKVEAGRLGIELQRCSLVSVLDSVEAMMRTVAEEKKVHFKVIKSPEVPDDLYTDPSRLRQCLVNLISNAIKFTHDGHVHVRVLVEGPGNDPHLRFDVEDTGVGIPAEKQALVFEAFRQADGSTTRKYGGTGLGLTITRELAELLGGTISLQSQPGQGSVFSLTLPVGYCLLDNASRRNSHSGSSDAENRPQARDVQLRGRVLVAEDVETNQVLIKILLKRLGLEVTIVENGQDVVKEGAANPYDVILMDVQMPRMNGHEATQELRRLGIEVPIVALTANVMSEDRKNCLAAGFDGYLTKPIDQNELAETLARHLSSQLEDAERKPIQRKEVSSALPLAHPVTEPAGDAAEFPVIAWHKLISRIGDEELIKELMPIGIEDNRSRIESLSEAIHAGDAAGVKFYAHAIKGAGINLGIERLAGAAKRLEQKAAAGDLSQAQELLHAIRLESSRLETLVSQPDWVEIAKRQDGRNACQEPVCNQQT